MQRSIEAILVHVKGVCMGIDAGYYVEKARFVPRLASDLLQLLEQTEGRTLLDLGCGDGELTQRLIGAGYDVLGADTNAGLLEVAQSRGIKTVRASGEELTFQNQFDIVFSNAALHWMKKAGDACKGVRRSLKPGGFFLGEMGGAGNIASIVYALDDVANQTNGATFDNPWYFPSKDDYAQMLEEHGFEVLDIEAQKRPTPIGLNVRDWLLTFVSSDQLNPGSLSRNEFFEKVAERLAQSLPVESGEYIADYVRLRFLARKI